MSYIGTMRLINALENGSYTGGTLNTALGTAKTKNEFSAGTHSIETLRRMLSSEQSVTAILGSTIARDVLFNTPFKILSEVLPNSEIFLGQLFANTSYITEFEQKVENYASMFYGSETAMKMVSADSTGNMLMRFPHLFTPLRMENLGVNTRIIKMAHNPTTKTTMMVSIAGNVYIRRSASNTVSRVNLPVTLNAKDITYGTTSGYWVAVGAATAGVNTIYYSSDDGVSWTAATNPVNVQMNKVIEVFGNRFVAIGESGHVATAAAASMASWSTAASLTNSLKDIVASSTTIVVVGAAGTIASSTNGTAFTTRAGNAGTITYSSVAVSGTSEFIAVADGALTTTNATRSTDAAVTWVAQTIVANATPLSKIVRGANAWYVAVSNSSVAFAAYSTNGTSWTNIPTVSTALNSLDITVSRGVVVFTPVNNSVATMETALWSKDAAIPVVGQLTSADGIIFNNSNLQLYTFIVGDCIYVSTFHSSLNVVRLYASNVSSKARIL